MRKANVTAADVIGNAMEANPYAHLMFTNIAQRILGGVHPLLATKQEVVALAAYFQSVAVKAQTGEVAAPAAARGPGRPPKVATGVPTALVELPTQKKRGRPRKNAAKRGPGRPRKNAVAATAKRGPGRPRKVVAGKRGPGRPRKVTAAGEVRRGPGRPRKAVAAAATATGKRRGRPPKSAGLPVVPDATNAPSPVEQPTEQPETVPANAGGSEAEILDLTFSGAAIPPVL